MANSAKKSFDIVSAHDYLNELVRPAYADFIKDALSSRKAITCVVFAWHLNDWIWAQHKTELQKKSRPKGEKRLYSIPIRNVSRVRGTPRHSKWLKTLQERPINCGGNKAVPWSCFRLTPSYYPIALNRKNW